MCLDWEDKFSIWRVWCDSDTRLCEACKIAAWFHSGAAFDWYFLKQQMVAVLVSD